MKHLILFSFLTVFLAGLTATAFSAYFAEKKRSEEWRYFLFFFAVLTLKTLLYYTLFYMKVNVFFETTLQIVFYTFSLDLTFLILFLFPFIFHRLLDISQFPLFKICSWVLFSFALILRLLPYLIKILMGQNYYYFDSTQAQNILSVILLVYCSLVSYMHLYRLKAKPVKNLFIMAAVFFAFLFLDRFLLSWQIFIQDEKSLFVLTGLFLYAGWIGFFIFYILKNGLHHSRGIMNDVLSSAFALKYSLTPRERETADLILSGKDNQEIADHFFLSVKTVKNHIYSLYQKMGVKSRIELAMKVKKEN